MPRFFTAPLTGDQAVLTGEDARHISASLRLKPGEEITLCDSAGFDYKGVIRTVGEEVLVDILERRESLAEPRCRVTLFQALPKGDKMEWIVQKAVELGVSRIVPVLTSRCVSRPDEKSMAKKVVRYQKIAAEAAKQSGRGLVPQVAELLSLEAAARVPLEKKIVFYEKGGQRLLNLVSPEDREIGIFVGSEGGFSSDEIALLNRNGVENATLGARILRCETAPLCGLSVIFSLTGDI